MQAQSDSMRSSLSCLSIYKGNRISTFYESSKSHNRLMLPSEGTQTSLKATRTTPQRVKRITWFIQEFKPYTSEVQTLSEASKTLTPKKVKRPTLRISQLRVTGSSIRADTPPTKPKSACTTPSSSFFSLQKGVQSTTNVEFMRMKERFHIKYEAAKKPRLGAYNSLSPQLKKRFQTVRYPILTVKESRLLFQKYRVKPNRSELFERMKEL